MTQPYLSNLHSAFRLERPPELPLFTTITMRFILEYTGVSLEQYTSDWNTLLDAQLQVREDFGEWVLPRPNLGPYVEPATLGCELSIEPTQNALRSHVLAGDADLRNFAVPNPYEDGMMGEVLRLAAWMRETLDDDVPIRPVMALHPFSLAYFLRGDEFFVDLLRHPDWAHDLLNFATDVAIAYASAQEDVLGTDVPLFHSDDIGEMVSAEHYREFAVPYMKRLFNATQGWNVIHECGDSPHLWPSFPDELEIFETGPPNRMSLAAARTQFPDVCLVGNISTTETMIDGTPKAVHQAVERCIDEASRDGLVIGLSGGVLPGVSSENLHALTEALSHYSEL